MDGMFAGPASERRRFLDRLALAVDAEHSGRVSALERALRSRNRLLEEPRPDPHWLDAIEHETAEIAVAVAAQRAETVGRLQQALAARDDPASVFPASEIALKGWIEELIRRAAGAERGGPLPHRAQGQPRARCRRRPHPRRPPSHRPRRHPCAQAHSGRRRLDRRAEGAAHRPRAGACEPARARCPASPRSCCSTRWWPISIRDAAPRSTPSSKASAPRSG